MKNKYFFLSTLAAIILQAALPAATGHKARQTRPISLGTSGGNVADISANGCCSGTLGSLVQDKTGNLYILSNTHVFAPDPASTPPSAPCSKCAISQPGSIDVRCEKKASDNIASNPFWISLIPDGISTVDAAIAQTSADKVNSKGTILEIGAISSTTTSAFVGQKVKKSGRTTGLTTGQVSAIDATITVEYTHGCGGDAFETTFKNQILITPGSFLNGGDSGSLLVENVATNPRAIGLLFAGSDSVAVANPIQDVLNALNVSLIGVATTNIVATTLFEKTAHDSITKASKAKQKHHARLMKITGVVGHAVGLSSNNPQKHVVKVLVTKKQNTTLAQVPKYLEGVPVEILEIGSIKAY